MLSFPTSPPVLTGDIRVNSASSASAVSDGVARDDPTTKRQAEAQRSQTETQLLEDQKRIAQLAARDREVRAHEQAHAAVGGRYAGAPSYQFERGPDGVNYAVAGEVPIDISPAANPRETLIKAQIIRRAALAPAEPSPQDRRVAAEARRMEAEARAELANETAEALDGLTRDRRYDSTNAATIFSQVGAFDEATQNRLNIVA